MIKHYYDKCLFLLALFIFTGALVHYSQSSPSSIKTFKEKPQGSLLHKKKRSKTSTTPTITGDLPLWETPSYPKKPYQGNISHSLPDPLLVEMFTPPEIHFNKKNNTWTLLSRISSLTSPGLKIKEITRQLYRFQYQGFIKNPNSHDKENYLILFKDLKTGKKILKKKGEGLSQETIVLQSISVKKNQNSKSLLKKIIQVTLEDKQKGKTITLNSEQPTYTEALHIKLYDVQNPENQFEWDKVGDTAQIGMQKYRLNKIDLKKKALLIEKTSSKSTEKTIHTLPIPDQIKLPKKTPKQVIPNSVSFP